MNWVNTYCFNLTLIDLLWLLNLQLLHSSVFSALAYLLEMACLATSIAHLSVSWTLPWCMDPATVSARALLTCPVWCVLTLPSFDFWVTFTLSDWCDSIMLFSMVAWALCTSILLASINMPSLVTCSSLFWQLAPWLSHPAWAYHWVHG